MADAAGALDHRDHRPGRLLPGRVAAGQGLRGRRAWSAGPATTATSGSSHLLDRIADRAGRPARPALADRGAAGDQAGRGLQPRRAVLRADLLVPAGPDRRVHRAGRDPHARGDPPGLHPTARFYQASRARRCSARSPETPQRETTPFYPRSPYGVAKVLRPLDHGQLPRVLRPLRRERHPLQSRVAAARHRVRHPQGHRRRGPHQAGPARSELRLGNLDARRDWGFAGDYVDAMWRMLQQPRAAATTSSAPARRTACGSWCEIAFGHVGLDWQQVREDRPRVHPARRGGPAAGRSDAGARRELGWTPTVGFARAGHDDGGRRPRAARARR